MSAATSTPPTVRSRRAGSAAAPFGQGAADIVPLLLGVLPLGLAIGATVAASAVPPLVGWLAGPLIVGGAAQLLTIQMLDGGAAPAVIVASALLVNCRVIVYGAAIAPHFAEARLRTRLAVAFPLIDQLFLLVKPRFERGDLDQRQRTAYYAGAATVLLGGWTTVQWVGISVGSSVPDALSLDSAAALCFAGLLATITRTRPGAVTAGTAGVAAVLGASLPLHSGLSVGIVAGLVAGWVLTRPPTHRTSRTAHPVPTPTSQEQS